MLTALIAHKLPRPASTTCLTAEYPPQGPREGSPRERPVGSPNEPTSRPARGAIRYGGNRPVHVDTRAYESKTGGALAALTRPQGCTDEGALLKQLNDEGTQRNGTPFPLLQPLKYACEETPGHHRGPRPVGCIPPEPSVITATRSDATSSRPQPSSTTGPEHPTITQARAWPHTQARPGNTLRPPQTTYGTAAPHVPRSHPNGRRVV